MTLISITRNGHRIVVEKEEYIHVMTSFLRHDFPSVTEEGVANVLENVLQGGRPETIIHFYIADDRPKEVEEQ